MASSRKLERYPNAYSELFAHASDELIQIECDSYRRARLFRFELYAFRRELIRRTLAGTVDTPTAAIAMLAATVRLSVRGQYLFLEPMLTAPELYLTEALYD